MKKINEKCKVVNLFKLLDEKGITSVQLSKACGVSTGNISDWKSGRATPNANKLSVIADYLETTSGYLLGYTDEKEKSPAGAELSEKDKKLVDAYHKSEPVIQSAVDKLLGIEERTFKVKIAARNGGEIKETTLTEEEYRRLMNLPDVEDI